MVGNARASFSMTMSVESCNMLNANNMNSW